MEHDGPDGCFDTALVIGIVGILGFILVVMMAGGGA